MFIQRLFAFFGNVWSFILTLVRSLLALFSFRSSSSDPFILPSVNRTPKDTVARAHSHLRPILLTPRSVTHAQSTRTRSAILATASVSTTQTPKLDLPDIELGFCITPSIAPLREETVDTSSTASVSVLPLTPPDRCYLAPIPTGTDCPYTKSWSTNAIGKHKLPASPLGLSIDTVPTFSELMVAAVGSPSPERWNPVQIWTSTPSKNNLVPEPVVSPPTMDPSTVLADISNALISRSRSSIHPYDTSNSSSPSDASAFVNYSNEPLPGTVQQADSTRGHCPAQTQIARTNNQLYPQFHYPDPYGYAWRRQGARVPGKRNQATRMHTYTRSYSHIDLPTSEWYDVNAYVASPIADLSPPQGSSGTEDEDEDEDEVPLSHLRDRLVRRNGGVMRASVSPRTRRMSEGCLLALSESTPTRIGIGSRSGRQVLSLALEGDVCDTKDWLEALSLRFLSEQKENVVPAPAVAI